MGSSTISSFYAYPSNPPAVGDSIRKASQELRDAGMYQIRTWEECKVKGRFIIAAITDAIAENDVFFGDLTGINPNVLFELGFAIARDKRIWLSIDLSFTDQKQLFERLRFLTTIGYANHTNARMLCDAIYADGPHDASEGLFAKFIAPSLETVNHGRLLYVKSLVETETSAQIGNRIQKSNLDKTIDDPSEATVQTLTWYGVQTFASSGVICHLLSSKRQDYLLNNARNAFVAGMAFGFDKPLLMLSEDDGLLGPLDYRDIARSYVTAAQAVAHLEEWISPIEEDLKSQQMLREAYKVKQRQLTDLKTLQLGEPIAENENDGLIEHYFIETAAFREAIEGRHSIFVGRKGVGKSATFLKLSSVANERASNLVCEIKPISYELQAVTEFVKRLRDSSVKAHALETIWKFLIYSEMANALYSEIQDFRSNADTAAIEHLKSLMERNNGALLEGFAARLDASIKTVKTDASNSDKWGSLTEALHSGPIHDLRIALGKMLTNRDRVYVLVDNLDKSWDKQDDLSGLSEFFLALLSAIDRISHDFRRDDSRVKAVDVSISVFLRSDIFDKIKSVASEPDKLDFFRLEWSDSTLLLRLIDERFDSLNGGLPPLEVWKKYFVSRVGNRAVKNYFVGRVLPRPRDLITFIKIAISTAVNRGHTRVEADDIFEAERAYSSFAVDSLLVETANQSIPMRNVIYEFLGTTPVLSAEELVEILNRASVPTSKTSECIEYLCSLSFIGPEVRNGDFRYADDPDTDGKNQFLARKLAEERGTSINYRIHQAYWPYLEMDDRF